MLNFIRTFLESRIYLCSALSGVILNFAFAPFFIWPCLFTLGVFIYIVEKTESYYEAFKVGYLFGFCFFTFNLYWISAGVSIYYEKFWWAIPFALFGLPSYLALYLAFTAVIFSYFKDVNFRVMLFSAIWIIAELARAYLLTGFPWSLISYSFANSLIIVQCVSIFGSYGLGIVVLLTFTSIYYILMGDSKSFRNLFAVLFILWFFIIYFGSSRINENPTRFTDLKFKLIQASIPQTDKWSVQKFWDNFEAHKYLSLDNVDEFNPHFIIWPESAVTVEPYYVQVNNALKFIVNKTAATLITGGVTNNLSDHSRKKDKYFVSIYGVNNNGSLIFDYHKSHLVPFGEYIPFGLPVDKITPGSIPFSHGKSRFIVNVAKYNLKIRPLLCYEIIFPDEVRMSNKEADFILNLTNDAYYGNTSGPYQHFYTTRMRSVENGLPILRVANNGITSVIDPIGRILYKTKIDEITFVNTYLPTKLENETNYSKYSNKFVYLYIIITFIISFLLPSKKD